VSLGPRRCDVGRNNRALAELVHDDRAMPSFIVSNHSPLRSAQDAYQHRDNPEHCWTMAILKPAMIAASKGAPPPQINH